MGRRVETTRAQSIDVCAVMGGWRPRRIRQLHHVRQLYADAGYRLDHHDCLNRTDCDHRPLRRNEVIQRSVSKKGGKEDTQGKPYLPANL